MALRPNFATAARVAVVVLGLHGGAAWAGEGDGLSLEAGATFQHDSNVFRLPEGASVGGRRGDSLRRAHAGLRLDQPLGRQRLRGAAVLNQARFGEFSFLDHDAVDIDAGWLWQLGNRWQGELALTRQRKLTDFADFAVPVKNLETTGRARLAAEYWLHPDWWLSAATVASHTDHSTAVRQANDFRGLSAEFGLRHERPGGNRAGLDYRRSEGRYPNRVVAPASGIDNSYTQDELEASLVWLAGGRSRVQARGGWTRRSHDERPGRDFDGLTGRLGWDWQSGAKSALAVTLRRELLNSDASIASYADLRAVELAPRWTPSAKLSVQGRFERRALRYQGAGAAGAARRIDEIDTAGLVVLYAPRRYLQVTAGVQGEKRRSNFAQSTYSDRVVYSSLQLLF